MVDKDYLVAMVMALCTLDVEGVAKVTVTVDTSKAIHDVGPMFVGVTVDSGHLHNHWHALHNFKNATLRALAQALSPCYLRIGGTGGDRVTFDPSHHQFGGIDMTVEDWENLNEFVAAANLSLIWQLNVLKRHGQDWDPANARQLLDFSQRKGFPLAGLELGNEPDIFHGQFNTSVSPAQLAQDFQELRKVQADYPHYSSALIIGPDVVTAKGTRGQYLATFLKSGGNKAVDVVSFHHYYMDGRTATKDSFIDARVLDSLRSFLQAALDIVTAHAPGKPLWLGETSSAHHGGVKNVSDRYVASFMWLDKLGMAAAMGLQGVLRQMLIGGSYALIGYDFMPNSDYWVTLLHKRLVGGRVLSVSASDSSNHTRVYAHCARSTKGVVLFVMNLNSDTVQLEVSPFHNSALRLYVFSPEHGDLLSRGVLLNGKPLTMNGLHLPPLVPMTHHGPVMLPAHQIAFLEIDDVDVPACSGSGSYPFG